jgi:hypothetical protein
MCPSIKSIDQSQARDALQPFGSQCPVFLEMEDDTDLPLLCVCAWRSESSNEMGQDTDVR